MQHKKNNWKWMVLFVLSLIAIGFSVYSASQKIDYTWQWSRIIPYIIDSSPKETFAGDDSLASVNLKTAAWATR